MHRVLVVVFDSETKVHEGENVLLRLDREGSIIVHCHAILAKYADGSVNLMPRQDFGPFDNLSSTPLASLISLLGGPTGLSISAATGFKFGKGSDPDNARLGEDFVDDVRNAFLPGDLAILCEIEEDWTASVDIRMERIGGVVFRRSLSNVRRTFEEDNLAAMQADIDQLRTEQSFSDADRKEALGKKINELFSKLHGGRQKSEQGSAAGGARELNGELAALGPSARESKRR